MLCWECSVEVAGVGQGEQLSLLGRWGLVGQAESRDPTSAGLMWRLTVGLGMGQSAAKCI